MSDENTENSLSRKIAELDWDIEPNRDLWPDISSKMRFADNKKTTQKNAKPQDGPNSNVLVRQVWLPTAIAASFCLAVMSVFFSYQSYQRSGQLEQYQAQMVSYQQAQIALIEQQHKMVRAQFVVLLDQQPDRYDPAYVKEVKALMLEVDQASVEIKNAIATQPSNTNFTSLLVSTYQQELSALNQFKNLNSASTKNETGRNSELSI